MSFQTHCEHYLHSIQQTRATHQATPELSLHQHLQTLLEKVTKQCFNRPNVTYTPEPKNINQIGRPDFIAMHGTLPIGYIEAEAYATNLDNLTGHAQEQNHRFKQNLDNFILTNFIDFELYKDGERINTARITENTEDLKTLLQRFLDNSIQIGTPEALARYLARRTRELKTQIQNVLTQENSNTRKMFTAFQKTLLSTLTHDSFADMYAQTLAYGLFAARCTLPNATHFSRYTAASMLPDSNPFLKNLFYHVAAPSLEANVNYILENIETLLQNVPTEMLRTAFATKNPLEDPVIHFYETFLAEYDPQRRVDRGVYYTPPQVISYIVKSVDSLLKTELNRPRGLADEDTLILDPATGTGGFLLAVLDNIQDNVANTDGTGFWKQYVNEKLVDRIIGFELLVAPYTIAHLKLSLFLQAHGWNANERLRIYLTNALEHPENKPQEQLFAPFISDEANAALSVKREEPILVILGNPPYQRDSANPSRAGRELTFIGELIEKYKQIGEEPLGDRNLKALQADYVKFIRWAQWRIEQNGEGILGYIVNNSFLDGPMFRGMRKSLLDSFNTIYHLNLHGSSRRTETASTDQNDENVFDIQQGVSILLCVKEYGNSTPAKVYYADMWGSRKEKYRTLSTIAVQSTEWCELQPTSPYYLFVPQETDYSSEYETGWKITSIFHTGSVGIATGRDRLTIHKTTEELRETVSDFVSFTELGVRRKYNLKDSGDWKVPSAQTDLRDHPDLEKHIQSIHYRPYDRRWTYYTGQTSGFHARPRSDVMHHLLVENPALCVCRIVTSPNWQHALITDKITEKCYVSNRGSESGHVFPLYLYSNPEELGISTERTLNLKPQFLTALSESLGLPQNEKHKLPNGITPEQILSYIYAVLYSPTYRDRYYEFLKYDFPRIPLPQGIDHFHALATLGQELVDLHLLKNITPTAHRFEGQGNATVERIRYQDGKVWINNTQHFTDVTEEVYRYEVGAYQVCEKWLKDRKKRSLSLDELNQYRKILVAIAQTIRIMETIDTILW